MHKINVGNSSRKWWGQVNALTIVFGIKKLIILKMANHKKLLNPNECYCDADTGYKKLGEPMKRMRHHFSPTSV